LRYAPTASLLGDLGRGIDIHHSFALCHARRLLNVEAMTGTSAAAPQRRIGARHRDDSVRRTGARRRALETASALGEYAARNEEQRPCGP